MSYVIQPGGHRPPGKRQTSIAPWNWVTVAGRWVAGQAMCTGGSLWPDRSGFTRTTSISHRIAVTPYSPALVRMARRGFNDKKCGTCNRHHTQSALYKSRKGPFQFRRVPQLGIGTQLKCEKISTAVLALSSIELTSSATVSRLEIYKRIQIWHVDHREV